MVLAVAATPLAALLACGGLASARAAAQGPPSFLHVLTDDQTVDSLAAMPKTERLLVRRGTRFVRLQRHPAPLLPVAGELSDRPVPAQPRRPHQPVPVRLRGDGLRPHDLHGARRRRLPDRLDRQGAERGAQRRDRPRARVRRVARPDPRRGGRRHVRLLAQRQRHDPRLRGHLAERRLRRPGPQLPRRCRRRPVPAHGRRAQPALEPLSREHPRPLPAAGRPPRPRQLRGDAVSVRSRLRGRSTRPPDGRTATGGRSSRRCGRSTGSSARSSPSCDAAAASTTPT